MSSHQAPALDQLAQHQEDVFRLVASLLRDEHAAEDVVQETWLQALEKGPGDPTLLGGWLRTVGKRLALNRLRGGRRRTRREKTAARSESLPSSEEIAERFELQKQLIATLDELPTAHGSVLRDRYFGGLTPTQIAARDGLALDTVKSRLAKARTVLRERLERDGLGTDQHWSVAILPLATLRSATSLGTAGAAASFSSLTWLLLMKKMILVVLACAGAGLIWKVAVSAQGPELAGHESPVEAVGALQEQEGIVEPAAHQVVLEESTQTTDAARHGAVPSETKVASGEGWTVRGRVRLAVDDVETIPSVNLTLTMRAGMKPGGEILEQAQIQSGSDGTFSWALEDPEQTVSIESDAQGTANLHVVTYDPVVVVSGKGPPSNIQVLAFPLDAFAVGVVRVEGKPVENAEVTGMGGVALTDAAGRYRLPIHSGLGETLHAISEGFGMGSEPVAIVEPGLEATADFDLPMEMQVHGRVVDAQGAPLANAEVTTFAGERLRAETDTAGEFVLRGIPWTSGRGWGVQVQLEGYAMGTVRTEVSTLHQAIAHVELTLTRGTRVTGRIVDSGGNPAVGASIWCGWAANAVDSLKTYASEEGRFAFDHVPATATLLGAELSGHAPLQVDLELPADGADAAPISLTFEAERVILGRVTDPAGEAASGLQLAASVGGDYVGGRAVTDAEGGFRLGGLPAGKVRLEVYGGGITRTYVEVPSDLPADAEVPIVVKRSGGLGGRVTDARTGEPIERFSVRLVSSSLEKRPGLMGYNSLWARPGKSFQDGDGTWTSGEYDNFEVGAWIGVEVEAEGYAPLLIPSVQVPKPGAEEELHHALLQPVDLQVRVLREGSGEPVEGCSLMAMMVANPWGNHGRWAAVTDEAGVATVEDFPPGDLHLVLEYGAGFSYRAEPLVVSATDGGRWIEVRVPVGKRVFGEVTIQGERIANQRVLVTPSNLLRLARSRVEARTGPDGTYSLEDVPPGRWRISLMGDDEKTSRPIMGTEFEVSEDAKETRADLRAEGEATVAVTANLAEEMEPGAGYFLRNTSMGMQFGGKLDADGSARIIGVPVGSYELSVTQNLWQKNMNFAGSLDVQITAGEASVPVAIEVVRTDG